MYWTNGPVIDDAFRVPPQGTFASVNADGAALTKNAMDAPAAAAALT